MDDGAVELDHIVIGVPDLQAAAELFDREYGLTAVEGGRHTGWGTANRLVPLGSSYLELVAVVDPVEAASSAFGRRVAAMTQGRSGWGWAVRTTNLRAVADRLGLAVAQGSRRSRTGALLQWQIGGVEPTEADPWLPFFVEWGDGTPLPGRADVRHRAGTVALSAIQVDGDPVRLDAWLGTGAGRPVPGVTATVAMDLGGRGLTRLTLEAPSGPIVLEPGSTTQT